MMTLEIETKRLELLHELAPASTSLAVLLNPLMRKRRPRKEKRNGRYASSAGKFLF